jgi:hypothetical protein
MQYTQYPAMPQTSWQGDINQPPDAVGGGYRPRMNALAQLSGPGPAMPGAMPGAAPAAAGVPGGVRQGYYDYLKAQGYTGAMGPDMRAYAQQLRASGNHPWLDYIHSVHPNIGDGAGGPMSFPPIGGATQGNGAGGGINPGFPNVPGMPVGLPAWQPGQGFGPPHTMVPPTMGSTPGVMPPQGIAVGEGQNALAALAGRRRIPITSR